MEPAASLVNSAPPSPAKEVRTSRGLYATIWRWHFYAGMICMPFLILLAVTGGIYLFKDQIDDIRYHKLYHIQAQDTDTIISPSLQLEAVKRQYPDSSILTYKPPESKSRTAEVGISGPSGSLSVFVNPYNGAIVGDLNPDKKLTEMIRSLHGDLMLGSRSIGDKIVETAACWAIVLLVTGLYLWWPRSARKIWGTLLPRFRHGRKTTLRDLHAVPMFWLSLVLLMLVLTGLPWSGLTGNYISQAATATNTGYPAYLWDASPQSVKPTKDVMRVPWAAENLPVPRSSEEGIPALPIENIMDIASKEKIHSGYSIALPQDDKGVYTISVWPKKPEQEATIHVDQFSGQVLASLRFSDYGVAAKWIEIGISLHEGHYFGLPNLLICLAACIILALTSILGAVMWWRRRPKKAGKIGAPSRPTNYKLQRGVAAIVVIMAILLPLVGITFIAALLVDYLILRRMSRVKAWMS